MNGSRNSWFEPPVIIAFATALVSVGSFWVSFDRRVTTVEVQVSANTQAIVEQKLATDSRLIRIEDKLDRALEQRGKE